MMSVTVELPSTLRRFASNARSIELRGRETVHATLVELVEQHPRLLAQIFAADRTLFNFIAIFINNVDTRRLGGNATQVQPGDTIRLVAALAGG